MSFLTTKARRSVRVLKNAGHPLVSIVLPTHNGSRHLTQSLHSCLGQSYGHLDLVVIDDASSDETPEILGSVGDPRLVRLRNRRTLGLPASLNRGFARARGDYLTWTSDDNWYSPQAIERMAGFLRKQAADFVYCDYFVIDAAAPAPPIVRKLEDEPRFEDGNPVGACFLYSRRVLEIVGRTTKAAPSRRTMTTGFGFHGISRCTT